MLDCPDLFVPPSIMRHVVHVESASNPFAVGVVGGRLSRQPRNLHEALEAVRLLKEQGYNFSVGIAQVNRYNLASYSLNSYAEAFEICPNLRAGSKILQECYGRAQDWGKAFSCYYSGNFSTGFQHGYVQKVFDSMARWDGGSAVPGISVIPRNTSAPRQPVQDDGIPLNRVDGTRLSGTVGRLDTADPAPKRLAVPAAAGLAGIPVQIIGTKGDPYSVQMQSTRPIPVIGTDSSAQAPTLPSRASPRPSERTRQFPVRGGALLDSAGAAPSSSKPISGVPLPQADGPADSPSDRSFVF